MIDWDRIEFFDRSEFDQPDHLDPVLITRLDMARRDAGIPFKITSDWRAWTDGDSAHEHGFAVDIDTVAGRDRYEIVTACLKHFSRVGVYHSDKGGHVHVDVGELHDPSKWHPRMMWAGQSR